jgi:hypothetical protein
MTMDKIVETIANANHGISQSITVASAVYTLSVYAKKGERDFLWINHNATGLYKNAYFNIATGVVGSVDSGWTSAIEDVGDGIYRCSVTFTAVAGTYAFAIYNTTADGGSAAYVGDVTKGTYLWGAQLVLGTAAGPYIPTTTVAVTRNADVLTGTGGNIPNLKNITGTFQWSGAIDASTNYTLFQISDGSITGNSHVCRLEGNTAKMKAFAYSGGVVQVNNDHTSAWTSGSTYKINSYVDTNNAASVINGSDRKTDASVTIPAGINTLRLGCSTTGGGQQFGGTLKNIYGYTRAFSQSEQVAVTS